MSYSVRLYYSCYFSFWPWSSSVRLTLPSFTYSSILCTFYQCYKMCVCIFVNKMHNCNAIFGVH